MTSKIKPGQIYKHYKGDLYKIITLAKHSETDEWMVVYERQTNIVHKGKWKIRVRTMKMFLERVKAKNYSGPRFEYIEG